MWFNNAGVSLGYRPLDEESARGASPRIVDINLLGHMFGCRAILPYFREHGGYLMNMVGRGWKGEATPYTAVYAATKTAIASLTRSLAAENKDIPNVSVNAFVPGHGRHRLLRATSHARPRLERDAGTTGATRSMPSASPLETVARETAQAPRRRAGRETGKIYSLLTPGARWPAAARRWRGGA